MTPNCLLRQTDEHNISFTSRLQSGRDQFRFLKIEHFVKRVEDFVWASDGLSSGLWVEGKIWSINTISLSLDQSQEHLRFSVVPSLLLFPEGNIITRSRFTVSFYFYFWCSQNGPNRLCELRRLTIYGMHVAFFSIECFEVNFEICCWQVSHTPIAVDLH